MDPVWAAMENLWLHFLAREIVNRNGIPAVLWLCPQHWFVPSPCSSLSPTAPLAQLIQELKSYPGKQ